MKILVTSGGTKVPIDSVRDITNMSSGTFGSRIGHVVLERNHELIFFCAKNSKTPFRVTYDLNKQPDLKAWSDCVAFQTFCHHKRQNYKEVNFRSFDDYASGLEKLIKEEQPDVVILAAAASDYGVENVVDGKIRSKGGEHEIHLFPLEKLISKVKTWKPDCFLVGFKLLMNSTDQELIDAARSSIEKNKCDMVVANDLRDIKNDNHRLLVVKDEKIIERCKNDDPQNVNYLAEQVIESADIPWENRYCLELPVV